MAVTALSREWLKNKASRLLDKISRALKSTDFLNISISWHSQLRAQSVLCSSLNWQAMEAMHLPDQSIDCLLTLDPLSAREHAERARPCGAKQTVDWYNENTASTALSAGQWMDHNECINENRKTTYLRPYSPALEAKWRDLNSVSQILQNNQQVFTYVNSVCKQKQMPRV